MGATGMASQFFENTVAEIMELADEGGDEPGTDPTPTDPTSPPEATWCRTSPILRNGSR